MRILIVSTSTGGGAGIAARRQLEALRGLGHDARFLSLVSDWDAQQTRAEQDGCEIRLRVPGGAGSFNSAVAAAYCEGNRTDISDTWLSLWAPVLPFDDEFVRVAAEFDVVHLHWVAHFVSTRSIRALATRGVRLVVTGHDMNFFTGGCHYTGGCKQYLEGCSRCEQLERDPLGLVPASYAAKAAAWRGLPIRWLFPSRWLANEFDRSAIGSACAPAQVVRNCIDVAAWQPMAGPGRRAVRTGFGFEDDHLVLVAGAQNNAERRKGFDFIEQALEVIEQRLPALTAGASVVIVTFGQGTPGITQHSPWVQHLHLGTREEHELPALFGAADLLLFPSREENFSNTVLESLLCGCPVIGFATGGVPEAVVDGENGVLVPEVSASAFAEGVAGLLAPGRLTALRERTVAWRHANAARFQPSTIASELEAIYRETAPASPVGAAADSAPAVWFELAHAAEWSHGRRAPVLDQLRHVTSPAARGVFYLAVCPPEPHPEWGAIQWLTQDAKAVFAAPPGAQCALVLQVPARGFPAELLDRLPSSMRVTLDGRELAMRILPVSRDGRHAHVVVHDEAAGGELHAFALHFAEIAVDPGRDDRQLCALVSSACVVPDVGADDPSTWTAADCALRLLRAGASASGGGWLGGRVSSERAWLDIVVKTRSEAS